MANKALTKSEIAKAMGCKSTSAISRLVALGYTVVCGRCGGSGQYSWNQTDGSRCFGCGGAGKSLASITPAIVEEALERIAAGELAGYFAEAAARREIKAASDALWATYRTARISAEYTKLSTDRSIPAAEVLESPLYRAQVLLNAIMDRASASARDKTAPFATRIATVRAAHAMLLKVDRAWSARG